MGSDGSLYPQLPTMLRLVPSEVGQSGLHLLQLYLQGGRVSAYLTIQEGDGIMGGGGEYCISCELAYTVHGGEEEPVRIEASLEALCNGRSGRF